MRVGFIGLGNVGGKLAASVLRNGFELMAHDLDSAKVDELVAQGAVAAKNIGDLAGWCDVAITCLPNPEASAAVVEGEGGLLSGAVPGTIWCEMSTTDEREVQRLGAKAAKSGIRPVDCPVSGGCHRAATGNISIFAGCERSVFEDVLPLLSAMGRRILHTGGLGSASILKVVTNYLATANLVSLCEALMTAKKAGMDLGTTYEAIRISSGNSFVHETESQVILNGSRNINFTMDLVLKDLNLFCDVADRGEVPLELGPVLKCIFEDAAARYGAREWSPDVVRRLEDKCGESILAPGFPSEIVDTDPESPGAEVHPESMRN